MSDTAATNRARIDAFYAALNARDVAGVMACYTDDATIEVFALGPFGGKHRPSAELLGGLFDTFPVIQFEVRGVVMEGDRVAVEVRSEGENAQGEPYVNHYHNFFELREGRVMCFREYATGYAGA